MLIVHSSDDALRRLGLSPRRLNDALLEILGPEGTLAEPAYPRLPGEKRGWEWMHQAAPYPPMEYEVQRAPVTTGILGWDLMRRRGSIRSRFPINSLVAHGKWAEAMFENELDGERPTACGRQSAWFFCAERDARVLMLGVDVAHTLTLNHVAEDAYEGDWPVRGWYRDREAHITDGSETRVIQVRERQPHWAQNYAEGRLNKDLRRFGVVKELQLGGVSVALLSARAHLRFLRGRRNRIYPYFGIPPWRRTWIRR